MLSISEYQKQVPRTWITIDEKMDLAHCALGIVGEYHEMIEESEETGNDSKNYNDETGDSLYYLFQYANLRNYDVELALASSDEFTEWSWLYYASSLSELVKKYIVYDKEIDRSLEQSLIVNLYHGLVAELTELPGTVFQRNIDKLRIRFPDKFEKSLAINKDTKKEGKK